MDIQEKDKRQPYSYHTFIYTFTYSTEGYEKSKNAKEYAQTWEKISDVEDLLSGNKEAKEEWSAYDSLCYFTPKARNAIFNTRNDNTSDIYRYKIPKGKSLEYVITSYDTAPKSIDISLPIEEMRLSIFPKIKVGIISIHLVNYDDTNETHGIARLTRAAHINECGRRLFFPNKSGNGENTKNSYIDTMGLGINTKDELGKIEKVISIDFQKQYEQSRADKNTIEVKPQFIDELLGEAIKDQYHIADFRSVFDDRMFTCSLVRDNYISSEIKKYNSENEEYLYYQPDKRIPDTEVEISSLLYGYTFIDSDLKCCSCQSRNLRKKLLKEHIYDRWIDYGTLYGFTEYSMTGIMNEEADSLNIVVKSFFSQYVELVKLCLMQRATINIIETDVVNSCKMIQPDQNESIDTDQVTKIWEKYIIFQNELYLPEVTFQEQGVEIYAYLKKFLKIEELNTQIGMELDNLHELTELLEGKNDALREEKTGKIMNIFSVCLSVSVLADIFGIINEFFVAKDSDTVEPYLTCFTAEELIIAKFIVGIVFIIVIVFIVQKLTYDSTKRKRGRKKWRIMNCGLMKAVTLRMNNRKNKKN